MKEDKNKNAGKETCSKMIINTVEGEFPLLICKKEKKEKS